MPQVTQQIIPFGPHCLLLSEYGTKCLPSSSSLSSQIYLSLLSLLLISFCSAILTTLLWIPSCCLHVPSIPSKESHLRRRVPKTVFGKTSIWTTATKKKAPSSTFKILPILQEPVEFVTHLISQRKSRILRFLSIRATIYRFSSDISVSLMLLLLL